jgi:hypothetical protein
LRWDYGLDFEQMNVEIVPTAWDENDRNILMVMPHYETRAAIDFSTNRGGL